MSIEELKNFVKRRRGQMLVHSYLYYEMDNPVISDELWQQWADELTLLQNKLPKGCKVCYYDDVFKDWDGSTGMHLPKTIIIQHKAERVLRSYEMFGDVNARTQFIKNLR